MIIGDSKWKTSFQGGIMKISTKVTLLTLLVMFLGFFCLWMHYFLPKDTFFLKYLTTFVP